jgi:ferrous-iron efflux pump FieF
VRVDDPAHRSPREARLLRAAATASVTVALTLIFAKTWGWRATDSVALLGSLADSFLDLAASLITYFALRVALEPADAEHRFGHGNAEAIAGIAQAVIISISAGFVAYRAIVRLIEPAPIESVAIGYWVMAVALILTAGLVAFQWYVVRVTGSVAVRADAAHYVSDLLTNLAVVAAIFLSSRLGWFYADPLLGLLVVVLILLSVRDILGNALHDLLDHEFPAADRQRIKTIVTEHPDALGVHDLRTRSSGAKQFVQLHLELDPSLTLGRVHAICDEVEASVKAHFPAADVLIHADPYGLREQRDRF